MKAPSIRPVRLLDDIRAQKIDVIVVYKVDRLTRSLADFAKLVELFDAHGVSFVSVTQQFNTTTSMGRLTLNVLLSFAQFEREVTSERIRDKIAASKRKGLWVGGPLPLGYQMKDGKIAVVEDEAERVRLIYRRYLDLGGVNALVRDLRERNIRSKARLLATGATRGGVLFGRGSLFHLLRNRFYVGEVKYREVPARRAAGDYGSRAIRCGPTKAHAAVDHAIHDTERKRPPADRAPFRRCRSPHGPDPRHQGRRPLSLLRLAASPLRGVEDRISRVGLPHSGDRHRRRYRQFSQ
jgi:hypothetical protein